MVIIHVQATVLSSRWWWRQSGCSRCRSWCPVPCRPSGWCWRCRWSPCSAGQKGCRSQPQIPLAWGQLTCPETAQEACPAGRRRGGSSILEALRPDMGLGLILLRTKCKSAYYWKSSRTVIAWTNIKLSPTSHREPNSFNLSGEELIQRRSWT